MGAVSVAGLSFTAGCNGGSSSPSDVDAGSGSTDAGTAADAGVTLVSPTVMTADLALKWAFELAPDPIDERFRPPRAVTR